MVTEEVGSPNWDGELEVIENDSEESLEVFIGKLSVLLGSPSSSFLEVFTIRSPVQDGVNVLNFHLVIIMELVRRMFSMGRKFF